MPAREAAQPGIRFCDAFYFDAESLVVGYDGVPLIKNVNIQLNRGEIFTLLGPNGAGKSTILKTITKQLSKLRGCVYLGGKDIYEADPKQLARQVAVLLTQRVRPELMTCEDIVGTGRYPYTGSLGLLTDDDRGKVERAMGLVGILDLRDRDFAAISDGQRQRVMLARALAQEPELLILDEPTSFLDIRYKLELLSILQTMSREHGMTVIMSLHELDLAERVSDWIMTIRGHLVDRCGPPEEIFTEGYINELYQIDSGSYDEASGRVELPKVEGDPEIFVLAGGGGGTKVFRALQRLGVPFACGVLMENDRDFPVASSLSAKVISVPAFSCLEGPALDEARACIEGCEAFCMAIRGNGGLAQPLYELGEHACACGKRELKASELTLLQH